MTSFDTLLARELLGNSVRDIVIAGGVFLCIVVVLRLLLGLVIARLSLLAKHTRTKADDVIIGFFRDIHPLSYVLIGLYVASMFVVVPSGATTTLLSLAIIAVVVEVVRILQAGLLFLIRKFWLKGGEDSEQLQMLLGIVLRLVLWSLGLLFILSNIGIDVTSLVASLGIGGIAVALAAQSILGDLFSAFTIYTDKPFRIGDFIIVGEHRGTVKHVGLKTTRIEALQGEEIVIPNNELTGSRIRNFKRMKKRRVEFLIGVEYGTDPTKLRAIPAMIKDAVESVEGAEFDRAHFKEFADSSLNYEIVFFVHSAEYRVYMDIREAINLGIVDRFTKEGIGMAFPTRTVHLVRS